MNKIISTIFTCDIKNRYAYIKKELISNVDTIFYKLIPILRLKEIKRPLLFNTHRFTISIKIGGLFFLAMIIAKERLDSKEVKIDEFSIYDLYLIHNDIENNYDINLLINLVKENFY